MRPALLLDPRLHPRPDSGLCLCRLPSPARALGHVPSSRPGPLRHGPCPCLRSRSGLGWSVRVGLCQSSRAGPGVGPYRGPRRRGLCPCWCSSSGPEAETAPCWPRGLEATHPSPPVLGAVWQWAGLLTHGLPRWPAHQMTSLSNWRLGNLLLLWKRSEVPHT